MNDDRRNYDGFRDWLDDRLAAMESRVLDHARGVRSEMQRGFDNVNATSRTIDERARLLTDRVTVIESARKAEKEHGDKDHLHKGALAGLLTATGLEVVWQTAKHVLRW